MYVEPRDQHAPNHLWPSCREHRTHLLRRTLRCPSRSPKHRGRVRGVCLLCTVRPVQLEFAVNVTRPFRSFGTSQLSSFCSECTRSVAPWCLCSLRLLIRFDMMNKRYHLMHLDWQLACAGTFRPTPRGQPSYVPLKSTERTTHLITHN